MYIYISEHFIFFYKRLHHLYIRLDASNIYFYKANFLFLQSILSYIPMSDASRINACACLLSQLDLNVYEYVA